MTLDRQNPYIPLNIGDQLDDRIRLLSLTSGNFDDSIDLTLTSHRIDDVPQFEALSYVWGQNICQTPINVSGLPLMITENLDVALRHLRYSDRSRTLWIDAICIDQNNVNERNHQVQLVGLIYSQANQVIIWLGPTGNGSELVMDCVVNRKVWAQDVLPFLYYADALLKRPYFSRVWIVQEVALASRPIVQCGNQFITLSKFIENLFYAIRQHSQYMGPNAKSPEPYLVENDWKEFLPKVETGKRLYQIERSRRSKFPTQYEGSEWIIIEAVRTKMRELISTLRWPRELNELRTRDRTVRYSFPRLFSLTSHLEATDPRDKSYGLLGIWKSFDSGNEAYETAGVGSLLNPDYAKSVARVFSEAMANIIMEDFKLGYPVLPLHMHGRTRIRDLPSWVPDLTCSHLWQSKKTAVQDDYRLGSYNPASLCPKPQEIEEMLNTNVQSHGVPLAASFNKEYTKLHTSGKLIGTIRHQCHLNFDPHKKSSETLQSGFISIINNFRGHARIQSLRELLHAILGPNNPHVISFDDTFAVFIAILSEIEDSIKDVKTFRPDRCEDIWRTLYHCCPGRTLFITDTGRYGLSIGALRTGDVVAQLFGIDFSFVLREAKEGMHEMVNVAYVSKGERYREDPSSAISQFVII